MFFKIISNFPITFLVIAFTVFLNMNVRRTASKKKSSLSELESKANSTRKKDLSNLHYITLTEKNLPLIETNDEILLSCREKLTSLSDKKIVNFTGYTNTELKLEFGAANLPLLSEYDTNFTELCRTLNKYGCRLIELGYTAEAREILEYAVDIESDISTTYKTLADIYVSSGETAGIDRLISCAEKLNSLSKPVIINALNSLKDSSMGR